jgi:hypothetical protein
MLWMRSRLPDEEPDWPPEATPWPGADPLQDGSPPWIFGGREPLD